MIRFLLKVAHVGLVAGLLVISAAWSFEPPTAAEFFGRFIVPEDVTVEVQQDGSVLISAPPEYPGMVRFTFRDHELPPPGSREVSADVTVIEDGGGWPDLLVGLGLVHGLREDEPGTPFSVGIVSPQDGGTLRVGRFTGSGFSINQALGGSGMSVGETVRLIMSEDNGALVFRIQNGGSSQTSMANDLVTAGMTDGREVGFIMVSGGTYRIDNLSIEGVD